MSQDRPTAAELVEAVREFLESDVVPAVSGRTLFHTRVAVNALGIVQRELDEGVAADAAEHERLRVLLGYDATLGELDAALAAGIRSGELDGARNDVVSHVRRTVADKVRIANPRYLRAPEGKETP